MKATYRVILLAFLSVSYLCGDNDESNLWLFEGLITETDSSLAPHLQSGWVLAGSFLFTQLDMEEEPVSSITAGGRLSGGISATELTIDLYHQLHFEAGQVSGMAGFDYTNNDPENDGRDMLGWFFPVRGQLKDSGWSSEWLQVWLVDPDGEMIQSVPPLISPYGINYTAAWFRLTFANGKGEKAHIDGRMDFFGPQSEADALDDETSWRGVAIELSEQLVRKDSVIVELRADLAASHARLEGLRNMVDLLVQERESLRQENILLQEKAARADPEIQEKLTEMVAEKALLESQIEDLNGRNEALAGNLADSELERRNLMDRLAELESNQLAGEQADPLPATVAVPVTTEGQRAGRMTVTDQTTVLEKPVVLEPPPPAMPSAILPAESKSRKTKSKPRSARRLGPRKFR